MPLSEQRAGSSRPEVLIVGGGVGALEALLALQSDAGSRVGISVLTARRYLTYPALSVAEAMTGERPRRFQWADIARDRAIRWIPDHATSVDPERRQVATQDGPPVRYDALVLAVGARPEAALPDAITFTGPRDILSTLEALEALEGRPRRYRLALVAPPGTTWTLPLYELALLAADRARRNRLDLEVVVVTPEDAPLGVFGAEPSAGVRERLAKAGVELRTGTFVTEYADGRLWLELEGPLDVDLVIAMPRLRGPALPGVPADEHGFVPVDGFGRVTGLADVWAIGDMTTRPLKQGGLATQQADVAAADIAAAVGAPVEPRPYAPVLRGMLLTGATPAFLQRHADATAAPQIAEEPLWWPAQKVVGHHLSAYLDHEAPVA